MSWLCSTQVLSESSTQSDTSSQNHSDIVGLLTIFDVDHQIKRGENKIGRDPDVCSIVLENKTLSKVHAVIECEGPEDTVIYDVGSTNKTKMGKKVLKPHVRYDLNDGTTITFGNVNARFTIYRESNDSYSQSLLSPGSNSNENTNNQRNSIEESPDINDSIFEASTQCRVDTPTSSDHVFKTPQFLKPKRSQVTNYSKIDDDDDIYSLQTQAPVVADECANLNHSDVFDQPTQCVFKYNKQKTNCKAKPSENLNSSDIFDMPTQCQVNTSDDDSIFNETTQIQVTSSSVDDDDFIFEAATQRPVQEKESALDDTVFEFETQKPINRFSTNESIFEAETQVPAVKSRNIFLIPSRLPLKKKDSLDEALFEEETQRPVNGFSKNEEIFEAETQMPVLKNKNKFSESVFDAETQQPEKAFSALDLDDSESSLFIAETQCPVKNDASNDSNEIIAALPDSIFQETTQIPVKTPQSEKKRKRQLKHDNVALFKGKRRSAEDTKDYLNDGEDDVLCEFMSQNSPVFNVKKENEKDGFDEDINLEEIPNHVFESDTQTPGYDKRRSHLDSGISDEKDDEDLTQSLSLNETVNDSGVKEKADSVSAKAKGSVNMVLSSSDEECDMDTANDHGSKTAQSHNFKVPDNRIFEDSIPTQVLTTNNIVKQNISRASQSKRELEDDIPTQVLNNNNRNEDIIPTQPFRDNKTDVHEDSIPTQIFNNRVVETSDDETDSDVELPVKEVVESSDTESDVESIKVNELDRIETPTSVGSNSMLNADDKSNDSFSLMKDIEDDSSLSNCKSPNLLEEKSDAILDPETSPNGEFLNVPEGEIVAILKKNNRRLSPTQILFEDEEEIEIREGTSENKSKRGCSPTQVMFEAENNLKNQNEDVLRKSNCSPTQVLSDSDTDCEESSVNVKKEPQLDETQVLPLSPPQNYKPRVLTEDDAWMLGDEPKKSDFKSPEKVNESKNKDNDSDDDWGPISFELPCTQDFERTVQEKTRKNSPEKLVFNSKRPRDSIEDTIKPKSKLLKNGDSPIFKTPRNIFDSYNCEITIGPKQSEVEHTEIIPEGRPKRTRNATWKVKLNDAIDDDNSPVIKLPDRNKRKPCIIEDESQNLEESDSPVIKLPKKGGKSKPLIEEDSPNVEQNLEPEKPRRRSARLQKSGSNSSCTSNSSNESTTSTKSVRTRNSKKISYFKDKIVKVLFTSYNDDNKFQIVKELKGEQVDKVKDADVVVTDKIRRTVKFLSALSSGLPIVTPDWLIKCNEELQFLDPWPYLLKDTDQEKKFEFSLKLSIGKAKKKKLLQGFKVFATPEAKPPPKELYDVVEHCGGVPLRNTPDIWPDKTIIISCPEDEAYWPPVKYRYVKIVHFEFLLTGVLRQKLDFKTYKLR